MLILVIRSDNPTAEVGLYDDSEKIEYIKWQAHRQLGETIHIKIKELLDNARKGWTDIDGIVAYKGPGSFTGLRISLSVANALATSLNVKTTGTSGEDWIADGIGELENNEGQALVLPEYGAPIHITQPRK